MKTIACWGTSGAGKTTVALGIAAELAARHNDVLVISADGRTPALPVYLPRNKNLSSANSIGSLLVEKKITEGMLKDKIIRHAKQERIFFMGYTSGETTVLTYGQPQMEAAENLLNLIADKMPLDYLVIDCDTKAEFDPLTMCALSKADFGVAVVTPDIKGYECYKAYMSWLGNSDNFRLERYPKTANLVYKHTPIAAAEALFKGFDYVIPFAKQVNEKLIAGELMNKFTTKEGNEYQRQMRLLCDGFEEAAYEE